MRLSLLAPLVLLLLACGESNVCPYPTTGHEFPAVSNCVTPSPR